MAKETAICINVLIRGASLRWWKVVFNQRGMDIITSQGCSIQPTNRILCSAMPFSSHQASLKTAIRRIMSFGLLNLLADPGEGFFNGGSACLDSGGDQQDFVVAVLSTHNEHFYATESGLLDRCSDQSDKDTTNLDS